MPPRNATADLESACVPVTDVRAPDSSQRDGFRVTCTGRDDAPEPTGWPADTGSRIANGVFFSDGSDGDAFHCSAMAVAWVTWR